jgi:hypothetical protein
MARQQSDSLANTVACGLVATAAVSVGIFALETALVLPERPHSVADKTGDESRLKPLVPPQSYYFPLATAIGLAGTCVAAVWSANENDKF